MTISMIAAVAHNYVIGAGGELPWKMPADARFFAATTYGRTVIMGRISFEDIGKPLSDRVNIIVTHNTAYHIDGAFVAQSLDEALELARQQGETEAFIIGGEQLFTEGLGKADKMYITWIYADFEGDTHFPRFKFEEWREVQRTDYPADAENPHPYSFTTRESIF
jgi:dihydrofolate reductase